MLDLVLTTPKPGLLKDQRPEETCKETEMTSRRFRLRGYSNVAVAEAALEHGLIDIAYVDHASPQEILITLESDVPFDQPDDFDWLKSVIEETLSQAGQTGVTVEPVATYS